MPYTLSNIFTDIEKRLVDESGGTVERASLVTIINSNLKRARRVFDLPSTEKVTQTVIYKGVYPYSVPSGFKEYVGLYDNYKMDDSLNFEKVDEFDFWRNIQGTGNLASEARNGSQRQLLFNLTSKSLTNQLVHNCDTFNGNGTWTANTTTSDAASVASDTLYVMEGSGSVSFNITVAQSANNYAELTNSTMSAVDLSADAIENIGSMFVWVYLPSSTNYTSFTVRWGSSSTAYYESTVTAPFGGGSFREGWNLLGFDWATATATGSPSTSAINYLLFRATYPATMTNQTGLRIDYFVMRQKYVANLHWITDFLVIDSDGSTEKETFTSATDTSSTLNMDASFVDWLAFATLEEVYTVLIRDQDARAYYMSLRQEAEKDIIARFPSRREMPSKFYYETEDIAASML